MQPAAAARGAWTAEIAAPGLNRAMSQPAKSKLSRLLTFTVLTQQAETGPGTALWGIDTKSGAVRWRTVVGTPWSTRWTEMPGSDGVTTLLGNGHDLTLSREQLRAGGFIEQPLPTAGGVQTVVGSGDHRLDLDGLTVLVPAGEPSVIQVRESAADFRPVGLPAPLAATPLVLGKNLLIPGLGGRIYLMEPRTGLSAADPFVPPFDRSKPIRWLAPVAVAGDAAIVVDTDGTIRRLAFEATPRPRLVVTAERKLDSPPLTAPCSTGPAFSIVTADGKLRAFSAGDLAPVGTLPLAAPPVLGPTGVAGFGFVVDAGGGILRPLGVRQNLHCLPPPTFKPISQSAPPWPLQVTKCERT